MVLFTEDIFWKKIMYIVTHTQKWDENKVKDEKIQNTSLLCVVSLNLNGRKKCYNMKIKIISVQMYFALSGSKTYENK